MNDNLELSLENLKKELDNSPIIQEYLSLKKIIENDEELKKTREDIARLTNDNKLEERDVLLAIYNAHPIVINYEQAREEVINLLTQIKDILSD